MNYLRGFIGYVSLACKNKPKLRKAENRLEDGKNSAHMCFNNAEGQNVPTHIFHVRCTPQLKVSEAVFKCVGSLKVGFSK